MTARFFLSNEVLRKNRRIRIVRCAVAACVCRGRDILSEYLFGRKVVGRCSGEGWVSLGLLLVCGEYIGEVVLGSPSSGVTCEWIYREATVMEAEGTSAAAAQANGGGSGGPVECDTSVVSSGGIDLRSIINPCEFSISIS
ncbi:hypothetical protein SK128_008178 [Halocaridina rubra]|uniref:Uncharacterized protein n=1 Tax=Halocaridina rubra TaxID=373956 RepID=A0AAN8WHH1_HALRR